VTLIQCKHTLYAIRATTDNAGTEDVDIDVEDLRAHANASMPAPYIADYIY